MIFLGYEKIIAFFETVVPRYLPYIKPPKILLTWQIVDVICIFILYIFLDNEKVNIQYFEYIIINLITDCL